MESSDRKLRTTNMLLTRRSFLANANALGTTVMTQSQGHAAKGGDRVRVGVIGGGSQGKSHLRCLAAIPSAEVVAVCDVDQSRLAEMIKLTQGANGVNDLRSILDDQSIDAVTIATPDHWHTPAALLALKAGKHIYVEKPCSHNLLEGKLLLDTANRSKQVVAHGTQARSAPGMQEAMSMLSEGVIGEVLIAKCWNWQKRKNIGNLKPSAPPGKVDYDAWVGPAAWLPFQANRFHYDWHWWYNFGCGGIGNDGIHELDYALWGLGVDQQPSVISAAGGKYHFDDDQQFPDTQQITFEWPGKVGDRKMLIYEQRLWSTNYPFNVDSGVKFIGTSGKMFISKRGKFELLGERNKKMERVLRHPVHSILSLNFQNWIDCIESGATPNASIAKAYRTVAAVHLGNISTRLGRTLRFDREAQKVVGDDEANAMLSREYRDGGHWAIPTRT